MTSLSQFPSSNNNLLLSGVSSTVSCPNRATDYTAAHLLLIGALPALGQATSSMAAPQAVLALDSVPANEANPIDALGYLDEATAEDHKMADTLIREEQVSLHSVLPRGSADTGESLCHRSMLLWLAEADGEAL